MKSKDFSDPVEELCDLLGARLVAHIAGVRTLYAPSGGEEESSKRRVES